MADKLAIYNAALRHLGERKLRDLTERREPRRVLDDFWDANLGYCLERKFWNFCYRSVELDASDQIVPSFGYTRAFTIPSDWIRTRRISASPQLTPPLLDYAEEAGYWYANLTPIYVQFNSRDVQYGLDLSLWPASFEDYVGKRLARVACVRITGSDSLVKGPEGLDSQVMKAYRVAAANCALNEAIGFAPRGSWATSRLGDSSGNDDPRGGSLIG